MAASSRLRELRREVKDIFRLSDIGPTAAYPKAMNLLRRVSEEHDAGTLGAEEWAEICFSMSSLLINIGSTKRNAEWVQDGVQAAEVVIASDVEVPFDTQFLYNIGNGLLELAQIGMEADIADDPARVTVMGAGKESLRRARRMLQLAGYSEDSPAEVRGSALCNLANALDESGRWVEAYGVYRDALDADPTNGNAAGNAAELLRRRLVVGRGQLGHYAAVYDSLVRQAQRYRARTVELAGEATAQRWDRLELTESEGHLEHSGDPLDEYQQWIKNNRLALSASVEGLGSDEPRWDSATIESVAVRPGDHDPPLIFASMNVLKAEFLAARRLAYDGQKRLLAAIDRQHPEDSGIYADTLDLAVYGEPAAMLVLAQRATLDLLDKIAVAANEHFTVGLHPKNVAFRGMWCDFGQGTMRKALPTQRGDRSAAVALAELAFDMQEGGMYPEAKLLRDAGTHRLVRLTLGESNVTDKAHSDVGLLELLDAVHESMRVARAAYLYLIDLVADEQDGVEGAENFFSLPLTNQE